MEPPIEVVEPIGQIDQPFVMLQIIKESPGQVRMTVVDTRKGTGHGGDGVGVVPGIYGGEQGLLEVVRGGKETPEGTGEGFEDEAVW